MQSDINEVEEGAMGAKEKRGIRKSSGFQRVLVCVVGCFAIAMASIALSTQAFANEVTLQDDGRSVVEVAGVAADESAVDREAVALVDNGTTVYVSKTGSKYHLRSTCSGMKNPRAMTLREAVTAGYEPCGTCAAGSGDGLNPEPDPAPDPELPGTDGSTSLERLAGPIALDTMVSITTRGFSSGSSSKVIVATTDGYWDALTASAFAGLSQAPVLLTDGSSLSSQTALEIKRLAAKEAFVMGGKAAVSAAVEQQIADLGVTVKRFAGATATDTANEIFKASKQWGDVAIVATSRSFHDALSIAPFAYAKRAPIFLTELDGRLSNESLAALRSGGFRQVCIVGGTAAVSVDVETKQLSGIPIKRLGGATAYETSNEIAEWCVEQGMSLDTIGIATGSDYYDALAGAALCGKNNAVLVLVSDENCATINGFILSHVSALKHGYVFGGTAAVSSTTFDTVASMLM